MINIQVNRALLKRQRDQLLTGKLNAKDMAGLFDFLVEIDMAIEQGELVSFEGV